MQYYIGKIGAAFLYKVIAVGEREKGNVLGHDKQMYEIIFGNHLFDQIAVTQSKWIAVHYQRGDFTLFMVSSLRADIFQKAAAETVFLVFHQQHFVFHSRDFVKPQRGKDIRVFAFGV